MKKSLDLEAESFIFGRNCMAKPEDNMAKPGETNAETPWADDESDDLLDDEMENDELVFDEFIDEEDEIEVDGGDSLSAAALELRNRTPSWRLIEMAREDKYLKSVLADFDEYDQFEYFDADLSAEYSH